MSEARYVIVEDDFLSEEPLVLRDVGPWDRHPTITNDADGVVRRLAERDYLPEGRRLLYYDSEGELTEIVHERGCFVRFVPGKDAE